jgi:hypothetical protein
MERTTQETVEQGIFSEVHNKRYTLAGEAPICNGDLFQDFGYLANTPASHAVLDGTYKMPTDSDPATADLFTEIAAIRTLIPKDSVSITNHAKPMETLLAGSERRDLLIRVRVTFWTLQGR